MKKIILVLAVLMLTAPVWAEVVITCTPDGNEVTVTYNASSESNLVRVFTLDVTVDSGAVITAVSDVNDNYYWLFPGSIDINDEDQSVEGFGSAVASPNYPGTLSGVGSGGMTIEMSSLYIGEANAPASSGSLFKFYVDQNCDVTVAENTIRKGVVMEGRGAVDVNSPGCTVTIGGGDTDPPTPNPAEWTSDPAADGDNAISMTATTGSDASPPIQYYFEETTANPGGDDSDWQSQNSYTDDGLTGGTQYTYRVRMRDDLQNTGGYSTSKNATATDSTPPTPSTMTWSSPPSETGTSSIEMTASTASDDSGVQYFFHNMTIGGHDSGWQDGTYWEDTVLDSNSQYCYEVKARDKSSNQNENTYSTQQCATTLPLQLALPWSDGFESGNFTSGGWTTSGSPTVSNKAEYSGTFGAKVPGTAWIEKAINTEGLTSIHVKYYRMTKGLDAGEYLYVEYYDAGGWHELESTQDTSWGNQQDRTCGTGANDYSGFKVRFRVNAGNSSEYAYVDDVEITGTQQ